MKANYDERLEEKQVTEYARELAGDPEKAAEEQKSVFEELMEAVSDPDLELGEMTGLAAMLTMDDEKFALLSPIFLEEYERGFSNPSDRISIAQALNINGLAIEDLIEWRDTIMKQIDEAFVDFSDRKIAFLKRLINVAFNAAMESQGAAKKIQDVQVVCDEGATLPAYAHVTDAGMDVYAAEEVDIAPGDTAMIGTGIRIAIPLGYAVLVQPRSGMSSKTKLRIPNTPGLIDSGYRGEIKVLLENIEPPIKNLNIDGDGRVASIEYGKSYHIDKGERIAQLRLVEVPKINFIPVGELPDSDRGEGGFGSSGKN